MIHFNSVDKSMKHSARTFLMLLLVCLFGSASVAHAGIKTGTASFDENSEDTSDFLGIPPFLERATGKPSVILAFDVSGSMLVPAYPQTGVNWTNGVMTNFDADKSYYGYFEGDSNYSYDLINGFFVEDDAGDWDGDFLNWLTMRRVDVARKVMVGGKVRDRDGESINGDTMWVLEGEKEVRSSDDYQKSSSISSEHSPIANDLVMTIAEGKINVGSGAGSSATLSDSMEVGIVDISSWDASQTGDSSTWPEVVFENTYTNPVVVVTALTYNGANSTVARADAVTTTGFRIGMQEWDSWDGNHTGEELFYMVAEAGTHTLELKDSSGNDTSVRFDAGIVDTSKVLGKAEVATNLDNYEREWFGSAFPSTPNVFAGVSTLNDTTPEYVVSARVYDVGTSGFAVTLQEEEGADETHNADEEIHYIAIEMSTGYTDEGLLVDIGQVTNVTHNETTVNFNETFPDRPVVNFSPQTLNEQDSISVRVEDDWNETSAGIYLKESLSENDAHAGETVAYMAVAAADGFNIQIGLTEEPTGLVQDNNSAVNFGLSVYNFDHKTNSLSNIVTGNEVHGATMYPCYPIYDTDRWDDRVAEAATDSDMSVESVTLYNGSSRDYLCVPTGVHAPNEKIVQVIEEYPLIWGTTPIAEGLVDIGRYVKQLSPVYQTSSNDSGDDREVGNDPFDIHGIGQDWDPYYDPIQNDTLECKKIFALHFNDGEPYRDFDGAGHPAADTIVDGLSESDLVDIADDSHGQNEALDNVALALRKGDCRDGGTNDLDTHQEVISYFVYAALGQDEQSNTATRRMREAAARGGFTDDDGDNLPDPMHPEDSSGNQIDFNAYAALNSTPGETNEEDCPANEWDTNSDCEPDTFFLALDGAEIQEKIQAALDDILARVSSGGAASVVSTTSSGEGAVYQASFSPSKTEDGDTVTWIGDVAGLIIDSQGYIRSDDGDGVLENFSADPIMDSCYDADQKEVRVKFSSSAEDRPDSGDNCNAGNYPNGLDDIGYLWSASDKLSALTDTEAETQRASYGASTKNRYIRAHLNLDTDGDGTPESTEIDFTPANLTAYPGILNTADAAEATKVVNFIRGVDQAGMRSRQLYDETFSSVVTKRLGDVIYSTPVPVGRPSENLHLLYDDNSYFDFFTQYRDRRTVVYVGGNDGMLHAFNGGWYDKTNDQFITDYDSNTNWELGQELWAFVPFNLMPHLSYLTNTDYGEQDGDHVYFVDQTPYVFDAQIFDDVTGQPDTTDGSDTIETHPNGWGTILVVGFRTGGGEATVFPDPTDTTESVTVRPAYLIFDITDPEQAPKLLKEFTHEDLGMSLSVPTALTVKRTDDSGTDWYLAFGSGPSANENGHEQITSEQNAHLFMLNLKTMELETGFDSDGVMDLGETTSFVGDIVAADYDLDVTTDALYFGTTKGTDSDSDTLIDDWSGKLMRVRINPGATASAHQWKVETMLDAGGPIAARPQVSFDKNLNRWIHFGTGRFFTVDDSIDSTARALYGLKEPRNTSGEFAMDTYADAVTAIADGDLVDVSSADVTEESGNLSGTVSVSPALGTDTVEALEARMMQYSVSANYEDGWKRTLDTGERAMGSGTILGGFLSQTTYIPDLVPCSFVGDSYLYALRYTTGTAWYKHVFGDPDENVDNDDVIEKVRIGDTPSLSPGIHLGESRSEGEATIINLNSDMSMTLTTESNLEGISSKETSWRELE